MVERFRPDDDAGAPEQRPRDNYGLSRAEQPPCIPSGCALLDCVLGSGWALGRIANIVGDKSVGKTLLAIEACANFARLFPRGKIWYRESEAAFDEAYAQQLGLPLNRVEFGPEGLGTAWDTVEDIFEDLDAKLDKTTAKAPGLYIVDSLDALSSRAELKRGIDEGSYGAEKAKKLGELFRRLNKRIKKSHVAVIFISQIREKIGITFGEKYGRSGGKSLDFYASQVVWLSHIETLVKVIMGIKRATAVRIQAKCKKNKIAMPFRECRFTIRFGYGMEDILASVDWLEEVSMLSRLGLKTAKEADAYIAETVLLPPEQYQERAAEVREVVMKAWDEVEARYLPKQRKYA